MIVYVCLQSDIDGSMLHEIYEKHEDAIKWISNEYEHELQNANEINKDEKFVKSSGLWKVSPIKLNKDLTVSFETDLNTYEVIPWTVK